MSKVRFQPWRLFLLLGAVGILAGGPRHPSGTMAQMLAHPDWVLSHVLVLAGYISLLVALILFRRTGGLSARTDRWARLAVIGTVLMATEAVFHTFAYLDHGNLMAGRGTPILTIHLALAVVLYPVFAATMIGFMLAGARERVIGSRWITWMGIAGAAMHGLSTPLVVGLGDERFRFLFPGVVLFALWELIAAFLPARATAPAAAPAALAAAT
jgi:cytochrome bd-type quinol oxidase subunit 2